MSMELYIKWLKEDEQYLREYSELHPNNHPFRLIRNICKLRNIIETLQKLNKG